MLDSGYLPMYLYQKRFLEGLSREARKPFVLSLERGEGESECYSTYLYENGHDAENLEYAAKIVKTMLWAYGGYKFRMYGGESVIEGLGKIYSEDGARAFDYLFMRDVYLRPLEFECSESPVPPTECKAKPVKNNACGYRIGFDAGGSDRKVTACINGSPVYENETIWYPKLNDNPEYHEAGIKDSIDKALRALDGRVDAIGVSTAGIVVGGEVRVASLFRMVPKELFATRIRPIYLNLGKEYSCPVAVANDGDVTALAGAYSRGRGNLLGMAMGTSLAGGYVDGDMRIRGCLNELAFVPVDANPNAAEDEWSGDRGVGVMYHSQDGVIKLAEEANIDMGAANSPAEKLKIVQSLAEEGDDRAIAVFERMGDYFGYTILWLKEFYKIEAVIFLGRVASGKGGDTLMARAKEILKQEGDDTEIILPDEMSRRLGQSYTASSLN